VGVARYRPGWWAVAEAPGYRFEPLVRRGLVFGLGPVQLGAVALGLVGAVVAVRADPGAAGFAIATGLAALVALWCKPVQGRFPSQWAALGLGFALRGRRQVEAPPARATVPARGLSWPCRAFADGLWVSELGSFAGQGPVGVVLDTCQGTATAVVRARGGQFSFLDGPEKERKLAAWASVLESVASERGAVHRLGWYQSARPDRSDEVLSRLLGSAADGQERGRHGAPPSQLALVEGALERAWRHETFLSVTVRCPLRRRGRPALADPRSKEQLRNEVRALFLQLRNAGFACDGVLDARGLALALTSYLVPGLDCHPSAYPWPLSVEERWGDVRVEGSFHRTYWVAEWPRSRVGPDFLSGLLAGRGQKSFSVHMSPVPPAKAAREAESSRTAQLADAKLRAEGGFIETAQERRRAEAVESREAKLAEGRGAYSFAGYVSVAAASEAELSRACAELERSARAARLCLRVLYGQQKEALSWALPFGRGL
jgi:hypothetical protein